MKISEIITDKYKLRIPPTVYYDLLSDVLEAEEEQEPSITWVTGADGAKIAFWDVPVWKVTKICEILGEPQESGGEE